MTFMDDHVQNLRCKQSSKFKVGQPVSSIAGVIYEEITFVNRCCNFPDHIF